MEEEEEEKNHKRVRVSQEDANNGNSNSNRAADDHEIDKLQAILMADTPDHKFRPITLERPKVLLPLLNIPMIDYTLTWLRSHGVVQVFVVCCDTYDAMCDHIRKWWCPQDDFSVTVVRDTCSPDSSFTLGGFLSVIRGSFLIVQGNIVSNMCIQKALQKHKEFRKKHIDCMMTMVVNTPERHSDTNAILCGYDELCMSIDICTRQLMNYEYKEVRERARLNGTWTFRGEETSFYQDCHIYICTYEVLELLYRIRFRPLHMDQFVKIVLNDKIRNYKIFTYGLSSCYAERVDRFRSYDTISKDLIRMLRNPSEADAQICRCCPTEPDSIGKYRKLVVGQSYFAEHSSVVGNETTIGTSSKISNSVIGKGCTIGSNVSIEDSYIWNNVTIEDDCSLSHAIICDGAVIKSGSRLEPDTLLSFQVVVGPKFNAYVNLKVSLVPTPIFRFGRPTEGAAKTRKLDLRSGVGIYEDIYESPITSEADDSEVGYIWTCEGYEEDWKNRISPLPVEEVILN